MMNEITEAAAGRLCRRTGTEELPLRSAPFALLYCSGGRAEISDGKQYRYAAPGTLLLLRTDTLRPLSSPCGRWTGWLLPVFPHSGARMPDSPLAVIAAEKTPVMQLCPDPADFPASALAEPDAETIPALLRLLTAPQPAELLCPAPGCTYTQAELAKSAFRMMRAGLNRHIPITELAQAFHVSSTHLKNSFRHVYGASLFSYMRTQKILAAAQMLRSTPRTVLDIAGEVGYDNGSKFAKAFRHVMGVTPRDFRSNPKLEAVSCTGDRLHA